MTLQTEFAFVLPKGYIDEDGNLHREGTMRLATAMDEIAPLRDPRVQANEAYFAVALLARVVTRLGGLPAVNTRVIENLFAADLVYLQDFYQRINDAEANRVRVRCPHCGQTFEEAVPYLGGS